MPSGIIGHIFVMLSLPSIRRALMLLIALGVLSLGVYAQTPLQARQILDSMINALGGTQFLEVKDLQTSGRYFTFKRTEVATSDFFADYIKFPDMERTEFGREK